MITTTKRAFMAAGFALLMTAPAHAVQSAPAQASPPTDRAAELRSQAAAYLGTAGQWRRAIPLLERSAALSAADDPHAIESLRIAGHLRANAGDLSGAQQTFERTAARALAMGAVLDAANAWIDAAFVAAERGDADGARFHAERAVLLAASPLLSPEQARSVTSRVKV